MPAVAAPPKLAVAAPATPTPAAPAAPPPKETAPAAPAAETVDDTIGDYGDELYALSEAEDAKAEGRAAKVAAPKDKKPAGKTVERPKDKATEGEPAAPLEEPEPEPEPVRTRDLRTAYNDLKKREKEEYQPKIKELTKLQSRVKELESGNPAEVKALQERLEQTEKRNQELESHIAYVDYAKSKEFTEKFEKPYKEAWADALADIKQLTVEDGASTRPATEEDLLQLANMPLGEARRRANELFGDSADDVMAHRRKIIDLAKAQDKALKDARERASERTKTMESESRAATENLHRAWREANEAIVKRWPNFFAPIEGDQEGNDLLAKGEAEADKLFAPSAENPRPQTLEEQVRLHAMIRNKVRNHDRLALWLKKARAEVKELKAELAQYEESAPNGGLGGTKERPGSTGDTIDDANAEIDELAKRG